MTFINEKVSPEIREKYHLNEVVRPHIGDWTVDYDGDAWLCFDQHMEDRETGESLGFSYWVFSWKGHAMETKIQDVSVVRESVERLCCVYRLLKIDIPAALEAQRTLILEGLETALATYGSAGVFSSKTPEFILRFEIPEELQ